jgi:hypothetical protein
MGTAEAAKRWAETWARAWPEADVDPISALYAPEATFFAGAGMVAEQCDAWASRAGRVVLEHWAVLGRLGHAATIPAP